MDAIKVVCDSVRLEVIRFWQPVGVMVQHNSDESEEVSGFDSRAGGVHQNRCIAPALEEIWNGDPWICLKCIWKTPEHLIRPLRLFLDSARMPLHGRIKTR